MEVCSEEACQFCGCGHGVDRVEPVEKNRIRMMREPCIRKWVDGG